MSHNLPDEKQPAPLQQNSYNETEDTKIQYNSYTLEQNSLEMRKYVFPLNTVSLSVLDTAGHLAQKEIIVRINNCTAKYKRQ